MLLLDKLARARQFIRALTLFNFSQKFPNAYLITVTLAAFAGYLYLLMFPAGVFYGMYQVYLNVTTPLTGESVLTALTWASVTLFCAGISHGIATLRFKDPEGIALKPENAPLIFNKLKELQQITTQPNIQNVILTQRFELSIIKTPLCGLLPFWSRNTLVIGFPVMQTLPPEYFDCAMTRTLLQYAKRGNIFVNWLSFLRVTWLLYPVSFKQRKRVGDRLSCWFFGIYGRLYRYLGLYITQLDELHADSLALNHMNDRDVFKTAESIRLVKFFLDQHFWPRLNEFLARGAVKPDQIKPYEHLTKSTLQMMKSGRVTHWLKMLSLETASRGSQEAPFAQRMHSMGYGKMLAPSAFDTSAAQYYFGPGNARLVLRMNQLWALHAARGIAHARKQKKNHETAPTQQRLTVAF
ncbi:MAG: hypothetical protein L0Z73_12730 [Gammaproteobacteria bacterium]|nr:hypothetical protein [Gammaproteobacteria bacterium]